MSALGRITFPRKADCAESKGNRVLNNTATSPADPWREDLPICRVYSHSPRFRQLLESYVGDVVKFTWHMVQVATSEVMAVGTELLHLDASGRIVLDQQFIER